MTLSLDQSEIIDALYGGEHPATTRHIKCAWRDPSGPRNVCNSAALIAVDLRPWNVASADIRLFHNPWATMSYRSVLTALPQAFASEGGVEMIGGVSAGRLLRLPDGWPFNPCLSE